MILVLSSIELCGAQLRYLTASSQNWSVMAIGATRCIEERADAFVDALDFRKNIFGFIEKILAQKSVGLSIVAGGGLSRSRRLGWNGRD